MLPVDFSNEGQGALVSADLESTATVEPAEYDDSDGADLLGPSKHEKPREWPFKEVSCGIHTLPAHRLEAAPSAAFTAPAKRKPLLPVKTYVIVTLRGLGFTTAQVVKRARERWDLVVTDGWVRRAWRQFVARLTDEEQARVRAGELYDFSKDYDCMNARGSWVAVIK